MMYAYFPEFDSNDCLLWHVYEKATEQIVNSFLFEEDAVEYTEFVERGGAFAGFTPAFITKAVPSATLDVNDAFAANFH